MNKRLVGNLQDGIFKLVEALGKKEGFLLIMEKREGGVMYSPEAIDITDQLIQAYNSEIASKSDKTGKDPQ